MCILDKDVNGWNWGETEGGSRDEKERKVVDIYVHFIYACMYVCMQNLTKREKTISLLITGGSNK